MKEANLRVVTFLIDDQRFAFPLECVGKVIRAVAVTKVPEASTLIEGVFDFHGTIVPLINLRKRFGLPKRSIGVHDRFIIVNTPQGTVAVSVDQVEQVQFISTNDMVNIPLGRADAATENPDDAGRQEPVLLRDKNGIVVIYHLPQLINTEVIIELDKLKQLNNSISP